jgi:serine/threonine protein kinase
VSVFHRDIKPENFIVTDGCVETADSRKERRVIVKLTDFGLATNEPESADMDCGSVPYMSYGPFLRSSLSISCADSRPECRNNCAPTYSTRAADVWSLGIVLINMYVCLPYSNSSSSLSAGSITII